MQRTPTSSPKPPWGAVPWNRQLLEHRALQVMAYQRLGSAGVERVGGCARKGWGLGGRGREWSGSLPSQGPGDQEDVEAREGRILGMGWQASAAEWRFLE